jgi:hypothetical protein
MNSLQQRHEIRLRGLAAVGGVDILVRARAPAASVDGFRASGSLSCRAIQQS